MKIKDIIKIIDGKLLNLSRDLSVNVNEFVFDSRLIKENDVFIAINKGNNYIKDIIDIAGLIITEQNIKLETKTPIVKVNNIIDAIGELAKNIRKKHLNIPLIAITGSIGKTTTKELLSNMLDKKYNVLKNIGNENNHIGLPKTLLKLNEKYDVIVTEMGMNHLNEIDYLSKIALPDIAIITKIGTSHIGNLKTKKNIYKAKMEIINGMNKGILIVNSDDKYLKKIKNSDKYNVNKVGLNNSDLKITYLKEYNDKITFCLIHDNIKYHFIFNVPNISLINNVILAIKAAMILNVDMDDIVHTVKEYTSCFGRMNIIKLYNDNILIDDCYNASYESVIGSLEYIKKQSKNKIIILGDILELGNQSVKIHKKIGKKLSKIKNKEILLVGNHTKIIKKYIKKAYHFLNASELIQYLTPKISEFKNTVILIKGSNGINLKLVKDKFDKQSNI